MGLKLLVEKEILDIESSFLALLVHLGTAEAKVTQLYDLIQPLN